MKVHVNTTRCTGCQICVKVCPQKILTVVDQKMAVQDESRCMGCFGCEDECPAGAVRVLRTPQNAPAIEIEPPPQDVTSCDVAIVGAGPAGVGAAITCAKAGLDVVVFERLPNRKLSHHTDGGVFFSFPGLTSMTITGDTVTFPELEISLNAGF
ncbi:FAD-binding protein, partial [candidate division KSB3 bacterium]|nr:FAD-binding protein [candidate division KSB3 bacterium]MBD3327430.1 FAD-binding protein [candidate division KSB3 bacterium]